MSSYFATCQIGVEKPQLRLCFETLFRFKRKFLIHLQILENKFSYITLETTIFAFLCRSQEEQFLFPKIGADFLFFVAWWFDHWSGWLLG